MELGDRVRTRREELKLSQDELAQRLGYKSRSSVNKVECGRKISQKVIVRYADALGVSPSYLMGWDESPEKQGEFEASILLDDDIMDLVHNYICLTDEQKKAVKQTIKLFVST